MKPFQKVRLLTDRYFEEMGLKKGDIGVIVEIWDEDHFEVDFAEVCCDFPRNELELLEENSENGKTGT